MASRSRFIALDEIASLPELAGERSRVFWFESPANPLNRIVDLQLAAEVSRKAGLFSVVDNTFASPVLQQPIAHGIDAVMHSATKYLGGHSDLTAGAVAGSKEFIDRVRQMSVMVGTTLDPAAAYLFRRGMKTLGCARARILRQRAAAGASASRNIRRLREFTILDWKTIPDHALAKRQMKAFRRSRRD